MKTKLKFLSNKKGFLGIDNKFNFEEKVIVIPFGLEKTVSYGSGTKNGPKEIIKASHQVELYDEELNCEPFKKIGITGWSRGGMISLMVSEKRLRDIIVSEENKFWKFLTRNTILNTSNIELDVRLLENYYKSLGYSDVKILSNSAKHDFIIRKSENFKNIWQRCFKFEI